VLAEDDVQRVILAPACFGGLPALRFALDSPERVAGFVGVQTPDWADAQSWIKRNDRSGLFAVPFAGQLLNWAASRWIERLWIDIAEPDRTRRADFKAILQERFQRGSIYCLASGLQATRRPDPFVGQRLAVPSAILWGMSDRSHRPTNPRSFAPYLTEPRLFTVPEAGHFPELTAPGALFEAIESLQRG
jgi:pimeloyl-ACP methyl ester carboxylesterase